MTALERYVELQRELKEYYRVNRIERYDPYPFQREFHGAKGLDTGRLADQRCLLCANQIGKTTCAAAEVAYHVMGEYPEDWRGFRYKEPVLWICAGVSNDSTKRIIQNELLGGMYDSADWGTGTIRKSALMQPTRKAGVPDAYESVQVKGKYGVSEIWFMAYEQGWQKFQGLRFNGGAWCDEEPPMDIWSQLLRGIIAQPNARLMITMTPEEGETDVVVNFRSNLGEGQAYVTATWEDAVHDDETEKHKVGDTHLTEDRKRQLLNAIPPHQREMRSRGIPFMGSGLVFPVNHDEIIVEPFEIPPFWMGIQGVDFGVDHPFGGAMIRLDPDGTAYLVNEYRQSGATPPIHRAAMRDWGDYPVAWPHDGKIRDKGTGIALKDLYEKEGFDFLEKHFSNPADDVREGMGKSSVEAGLFSMLTAMETGKFKVFSTCKGFLEEIRSYHRKNGQLIKERDDIISATRYAYQSRRFAKAINRVWGEGKPIRAKVTWSGLH